VQFRDKRVLSELSTIPPVPGAPRPEVLRAIAPLGALGRASEVGRDDLDALIGPAEVVGMLTHGALQLLTFGV